MGDASNVFGSGPGPQRQSPVSPANEKSRVFSTKGCVVQSVVAENINATNNAWLMLFNAASLPANGAVPSYPPLQAPSAGGFASMDESTAGGMDFGLGLVAALSSTKDTLTLVTANDGSFKATIT